MWTGQQQLASKYEENKIGNFAVNKYTIDKKNPDFQAMLAGITPGDYVRLLERGECVMSNTYMEYRTNSDFIHSAHGDVFIAGLGLGLIVREIQVKDDVTSITVLEKNKEVIDLVVPNNLFNGKVKIINGDAWEYEFQKGTKFDSLYLDIWTYINSDVYEDMKKLKRRYMKYRRDRKENPKAFIKCWAEYHAKHNLRL